VVAASGTRVVTSDGSGVLKEYSLSTEECTRTTQTAVKYIYALVFDDEDHLYVGGRDSNYKGFVQRFNTDMEVTLSCNTESRIYSLAVVDDMVIAGSSDGTISIFNRSSGDLMDTLKGHGSWVDSLQVVYDGVRMLLISGSYDKTCRIWDFKTRQCINTIECGDYVYSACAVGNLLYAGTYDKGLEVHTLGMTVSPLVDRASQWREDIGRMMSGDVRDNIGVECVLGCNNLIHWSKRVQNV